MYGSDLSHSVTASQISKYGTVKHPALDATEHRGLQYAMPRMSCSGPQGEASDYLRKPRTA